MPKISRSGNGRRGRRQARQILQNLQHESEKQAASVSFTDQYRRWQRQRFLAGGLVALGVVVVFTHVVVHLGNIEWLPTTGMQDLLTGYPMGAVLIVIGMILLPRS